ncbi:hypothetical protein T10_483 [Trichinella papuae]|uniref:Uncharacterized protein n=1 Tax=Trichinella papuae TaxID=268474 RepID=A0A0V1MEP7_9BILA|nr:hypothetical protein T10_483 [Trichinella papuae]
MKLILLVSDESPQRMFITAEIADHLSNVNRTALLRQTLRSRPRTLIIRHPCPADDESIN